MTKDFFLCCVLLAPIIAFGQTPDTTAQTPPAVAPPAAVAPAAKVVAATPPVVESQFTNKRISFIVGVGASYITSSLYQDPVVNKTNNNVIIAKSGNIKTNLSLGIAYTPKIFDIISNVRDIKSDGTIETKQVINHVPKGITFATFLNPVSLTKVTQSQPFFSMVDFGVGVGYRTAGGVLFLVTTEFFSVNQPRQWFVDQFKNNNSQYIIGGAAQTTIDLNDNSIFTNKSVITFGFKVCYTFDIVKNFYSSSQNLTSN